MCMANPLDQFTTYVSQNPDSLTGSVARRSTVNPVARRLTDVLDAASTTEPVLNDLVTIVDTTAVDQDVPAVTPTITLAVDSVEALKASIFTDFIQPFINTQTAVSLLDDLADVAITSPTVGQVLKYTGTNWANGTDAGGVGGGSNLLSALTDIQLGTLANGQVLKYNSATGKWVNGTDATATVTAITGLTDVAITTPTNGQVLKYDTATSKWVNAADALATTLGDVTLAGTQTLTGEKTFTGGIISNTFTFVAGSSIRQDSGTSNIIVTPLASGAKLTIGAAVGASTVIANNGGVAAYEFNLADFRCAVDVSRTLGSPNFKWGQIYSSSATINTSDERSKTDIVDCPLGLDFILDLDPKFFKLRVAANIEDPTWSPDPDYVPGPGDPLMQRPRAIPVAGVRDHAGLLAQQVKAALDRAGITDWAGWGLDDKDDPASRQYLRYEEFIAPLIKSLHTVCDRLDSLEQRLSNLENP